MKSLGEMLASSAGGQEIMMGNTALVRAMIESGVRVVTTYPGSPTPEIAEAIRAIPSDRNPLYFQYSVNEKVATEVAFGASINGHLSCVFFKSVGLNVAADTFVQLNHVELLGGLVIVLGDDPGANSSQNEQDNLHYAHLAYIPVFEPATPAEAYEMFKEAARLSQERRMPIILRLTTHVCHAKQKVTFAPWQPTTPDNTPRFAPENGPYMPLASLVLPMKRKALTKLRDFAAYSETSRFNRIEDNGNPERGIIAFGLPYLSLREVMEPLTPKPDILKLGVVYPLPNKLIGEFLRAHKQVKVLEELDCVIEKDIKMLAFDENIRVSIAGKSDLEDWIGEYTPDKVYDVLSKTWPELCPPRAKPAPELTLAPRPPQMCPGCGHRSAFFAVKQALHDTDITVADIGCHTLGYFPPYQMGQVLLCMGHANGTAAGLSLFNSTRKVVCFLGDSTFFHAGLPGIINAIFNHHNHTLIIMENGTTAMTGHQDNPVRDISIAKLLEGMGVKSIRQVDAYSQKKLIEYVKEAVNEDFFSVIIASHPCMLKHTRDARRAGKPALPPVVITESCNRQNVCISEFGCPTYQFGDEGGVYVEDDLCIGDGSCVQTCPTKAIKPQRRAGQ